MFRLTTRLLALSLLAAAGAAACSDNDDARPSSTSEASTTATTVADPAPQLIADLGDPIANEQSADGGLVMRWVVDDSSAERVANDLAERVGGIPGLVLAATEVTDRGSIIAFEGVRSGHYLVTRSTGQGTPLELRLEPIATPAPTFDAGGVPLPAGFPTVEVPIFPGATVIEASRTDLGGGLLRFDLTLASERAPVEVLGYYRDLFHASGWTVAGDARTVEVHGSGRVTTVWVREVRGESSQTTLEVVVRGEGAP